MVTLYAPKDLNLHIAIAYIEAGEEQEIPETAISLGTCGCNEYTVEGTLTNEKGEALFKIIQCSNCYQEHPYVTNIILPQEEQ